MVILDVDHPDIESYILWKVQEEYKVASLVAGSTLIRSRLENLRTTLGEFYRSKEGGKAETDPSKIKAVQDAITNAIQEGIPAGFIHQYIRLLDQGIVLPDTPSTRPIGQRKRTTQ
jgi:ribonucleoside-diphosphate reductase alpha chain